MNNSDKPVQPSATANQDATVSFEWQGVLDQSYDALDQLVHRFAGHVPAAGGESFVPTAPTIVGQFDGVLPLSHYVL